MACSWAGFVYCLPLAQPGGRPVGARADWENIAHRSPAGYRKYYQPDITYLVVAGKINPRTDAGKRSRNTSVHPR